MATKQRKISAHGITIYRKSNEKDLANSNLMKSTINFIIKTVQKHKIETHVNDKYIMLDTARLQENGDNELHFLTFITGTYNYITDLLNIDTGASRNSGQALIEGRKNKVHVILEYSKTSNEILILIEEYQLGMSFRRMLDYLENHLEKYQKTLRTHDEDLFVFNESIVPSRDFFTEINSHDRVSSFTLTARENILGSEALNNLERYIPQIRTIEIKINAKVNGTILDGVLDFYNHPFQDAKKYFSKIRFEAKDENGNRKTGSAEIDDFGNFQMEDALTKTEYIRVKINKITGQVESQDCFLGMIELLEELG